MESVTVIRMRTMLHYFLFTIAFLSGALPLLGQAPASPVRAEFHTVKASAFEEKIETVGSLRANESVTLMAESPRRLVKILCEEGLSVKAGDLLFQLDDAELQTELQEIESRLVLALANKQRAEGLLPSKAISQQEADVAAAEWRVLEAQKNTKLVQIAKARIVAPFAGRLGVRKVSEGAMLSTSLPLIDLHDLSAMKIDFPLPEHYAGMIREKQKFTFTVAGLGKVHEGVITVIEPAIDMQTRSLLIRGVCSEPEGLVPGGFADVSIPLTANASNLLVPSQAIVPSPRGHGVYVVADGKAQFREVVIGIRTDEQVQILRGLAEGDVVATTNLNRIRPGVSVSLVATP
jgi:membrane fusion protein (multidrug efflux system)